MSNDDLELELQPNRRKALSSLSLGFMTVMGVRDITLPEEATAFDFSVPGTSTNFANLARKIRNVCVIMDELQRDLQQERWDLVEAYPAQLRSFVPVFTTYTDEVFESDDLPSNKGLRVALRYEVGRFFGSLERLKQATARKDLNEAYIAYSNMAIHFDRYLKAGNLYTYVDPLVSTEPLFEKVSDALVYSNPKTDPPEIRDLVILCQGPDKGKTGIVIGIFPDTKNVVVKLDRFSKTSPIREIKVGKSRINYVRSLLSYTSSHTFVFKSPRIGQQSGWGSRTQTEFFLSLGSKRKSSELNCIIRLVTKYVINSTIPLRCCY